MQGNQKGLWINESRSPLLIGACIALVIHKAQFRYIVQ